MNQNRAIAVGVDLGTSGVRVAALGELGNIVGMALSSYGSAEERRKPEAWWRHVRQSLKQLATEVRLDGVRGIAVDGTSGSLLALDAAGKALGEASLYNDTCNDTAILAAIDAHAPPDSAARGHTSPLARAFSLQKLGGIAQVVHQADWIAAQIAGDGLVISDENNALKTGFDLNTRCWPDLMERIGFDRSLLPTVCRPDLLSGLFLPVQELWISRKMPCSLRERRTGALPFSPRAPNTMARRLRHLARRL